ncbi:MAG: hypothetical protein ATN35_01740 [Epulopiscium sp. Nele67-Bin004]|nr:MAG: hypothetical protein ATN35_01740 [Epulopiscium sp. Nele67-Bin004]
MGKENFRITKEFNTALNDIANYNPSNKIQVNKPIIPKYEGILNLAGVDTTCYVTESGIRVLASRRLQDVMKVADDSDSSGSRWGRFLRFQWFQSLLDQDFNRAALEPIEMRVGNRKIVGYRAELIPEICEVILKARDEEKLTTARQLIIAKQCEILVRSLAKVGIIALVDEATGYQYDRKHDALRYILAQYIDEGLREWIKTFPDEFFNQLDRLYDNEDTKPNARPKYYGKFINQYIYEPIEKGIVKEELNKLNITDTGERKARFHQWLTEFGKVQLKTQIIRVLAIMEVSDSLEKFKSTVRKQKDLNTYHKLLFADTE